MERDTGRERLSGRIGRTRRRVLQATAVGAAGLAGCAGGQSGTTTRGTAAPPATLVATWRGGDPATATTLQWIAETDDQSDPVSVTLAAGDDSATTTTEVAEFGLPDSIKQMVRHRATFDGLTPDTEYRIEVAGTDRGVTVRTAPRTLDEPLVVAQGGDLGTSAYVPQLHGHASSWDPLFALVGGDLAYADATSVIKWEDFLEQWHEHMQSDGRLIPIATIIGNHEVVGHIHGDPEDAPFFYTLFDNRQRDRAYWMLDIGESVSVAMLDSNHTTPVPGEQTEWLEARLAERTDREHLSACYHVPAYPSSKPITGAGRDRVDVREEWVPLFDEYDVDVCFEHDDHTYKRTHRLTGGEQDPDGVRYVGDGAWGRGPRQAVSTEERPYLAVSESRLHVFRVEFGPDGSRQYRAVGTDGETVDSFDDTTQS